MRVLRAMGGALLWVVASVVCLVALILSVTVVLLPLGIPLFMLGRKLFAQAIRLFMPRAALHPVKTSGKASRSAAKNLVDGLGDQLSRVPRPDGKKARKQVQKSQKKLKKVANA
jgi:hypothetical protein